jgi:hypothetical protein
MVRIYVLISRKCFIRGPGGDLAWIRTHRLRWRRRCCGRHRNEVICAQGTIRDAQNRRLLLTSTDVQRWHIPTNAGEGFFPACCRFVSPPTDLRWYAFPYSRMGVPRSSFPRHPHTALGSPAGTFVGRYSTMSKRASAPHRCGRGSRTRVEHRPHNRRTAHRGRDAYVHTARHRQFA